jgi:RNA polymerase sigma-70 factor, ECF subfamily
MNSSTRQFRDDLLAIAPQLRAYARALCRRADKADDLLQDTLLRAWEKQDSLRDEKLLKPWLLAIMRNAFRQQQRHARFVVEDFDDAIHGSLFAAGNQESNADLGDVAQALAAMPADQREAIVLILVNEISYDQAAALAGCAPGTMKSRVHRARRLLVKRLGLVGPKPVGQTSQQRPSIGKALMQLEPRAT